VVHGRLDLVRAEGVDQLIRATGSEGVRIARDAVSGRLGIALGEIRAALVGVVAELEARLDWPGDDLAYETDAALVSTLAATAARSRALADTFRAGRIRVEGARVALVGPVNAGKSSLFNALLGQERALVHPTPGTTRDVIEARRIVGGVEITLLDTAGDRSTSDPVEALGLALGRRMVEDADLVLQVIPATPQPPELPPPVDRGILVYNGIDRPGVAPPPPGAVPTSALTGAGVDRLVEAIAAALGARSDPGLVLASARQRDRLEAVARAIDEAIEALPLAGVAVAADRAVEALEEIDAATGADTREDVLDAVFARFCIGK
jgi:tRNA modification GTPase